MMPAGKFNRIVRVERPVAVVDPEYGTTITSWVPVSEFSRANVQDVLPSKGESAANGIDVSRRPARVRMRWRTDIDARMRLVFLDRENRIMEIVTEPAEFGDREAIEFMVVEYSVRGDA